MTTDDVLVLARRAGLATTDRGNPNGFSEYCKRLELFATLVAADTRESCTQACIEAIRAIGDT